MYVGVRSCKARNTIMSVLYSMRYFTGSQWICCNAAVMLRRSPHLIRRTTLAAECWTISTRCKRLSDMPYRTAFPSSSRDVTRACTLQFRNPRQRNETKRHERELIMYIQSRRYTSNQDDEIKGLDVGKLRTYNFRNDKSNDFGKKIHFGLWVINIMTLAVYESTLTHWTHMHVCVCVYV